MKDKIKNGYFFKYECEQEIWLKVGSRCYLLPIYRFPYPYMKLFRKIEEEKIIAIYKANGQLVERREEE